MTNLLTTAQQKTLNDAFRDQRLTLYLGAGVSMGSGLPTWDKLLLGLYFRTTQSESQISDHWFPNYIYAAADWAMKVNKEPLDIAARALRVAYPNTVAGNKQFKHAVRAALWDLDPNGPVPTDPFNYNLQANETLKAVAELCAREIDPTSTERDYGVRSVITTNYDDLLERALGEDCYKINHRIHTPVYSEEGTFADELPVFHVHGYLPYPDTAEGPASDVVLTEAEYNLAANDPYSWSNIVQMREMSSSVGLAVGLSMDDRNIRRLLDALSKSPVKPNIFALMPKPKERLPTAAEAKGIHEDAMDLFNRINQSGKKSSSRDFDGEAAYVGEIKRIVKELHKAETQRKKTVLGELGITPLWVEDFDTDIPDTLAAIGASVS